ncbi:MAG TPA: hypothetical protein DCP90_05060 [Clostridiales bacterium]|nr:MAG: hypothetical protein A2Y22_06205 [Clostridiales bacterium GWD2_32_59]HAN09968.1 hypothetical protein [Clostridiales bacterium]
MTDKYIEEIHKIREKNHEITKNMTIEERLEYMAEKRKKVKAYIQMIKLDKSETSDFEHINKVSENG